jgi:hypothetical protein
VLGGFHISWPQKARCASHQQVVNKSHRIHGAAIYGNMDPINIPPMLAYIYIYEHHGSYGHVNINTVSRTLSPPRARRKGVVATYCNHLGVSLALLRRGLLALEWLGLGEGGRMWHDDGSKPIQDYIWIYLEGIKFINPS